MRERPCASLRFPDTKASVKAFQAWGGVASDGVVGDETWAVSLLAGQSRPSTSTGVSATLRAGRLLGNDQPFRAPRCKDREAATAGPRPPPDPRGFVLATLVGFHCCARRADEHPLQAYSAAAKAPDGEAGMERQFDGFLAAHSINIEAEPTPDAVLPFGRRRSRQRKFASNPITLLCPVACLVPAGGLADFISPIYAGCCARRPTK
jgi:hypothetical protein